MTSPARAARLLFPALRWSEESGYDAVEGEVAEALRLGVGGFILFGGESERVRALVDDLRWRSPDPLLIAADLERGAGQQFAGCTPLPPAWALASLFDLETLWRAGELTGREARAVGVDWVYAPVADLGNEPNNPIVGTRAFGSDPQEVAKAVVAWSLGCLAGGALPCVKHFPGHGRTLADSHVALPVVHDVREDLADDLVPFTAAVSADIPSLMTAHVSYPALDPRRPATRSPSILRDLLRRKLGFQGVVVSDALIMAGVTEGSNEAFAAIEAVGAGVDALLYPRDPAALARALDGAPVDLLPPDRIREAAERLDRMTRLVKRWSEEAGVGDGGTAPNWGREEDRRWARDTALRSVTLLRDPHEPLPGPYTLVEVDDDVGGPYPAPSRATFIDTMRGLGVEVALTRGEASPESAATGTRLVAVYADTRGWKGRSGLSAESTERLRRALQGPGPVLVALFSHPWNAAGIPEVVPILCAWGGEPLMQEAAARAVARLSTQ
jgi:beta-glucosidase-like glycosyl hydrolase